MDSKDAIYSFINLYSCGRNTSAILYGVGGDMLSPTSAAVLSSGLVQGESAIEKGNLLCITKLPNAFVNFYF